MTLKFTYFILGMNPFMPMMAGGFPNGMPPFWQPFQVPQQPQQQAGAQPTPAAPAGQAAPGTTAENAATPGMTRNMSL
jgi:hypothetical protein